MTHTIEVTTTASRGKDIARRITELIEGEDIAATMIAMTFIVGSMGGAFYDEDKEDFMNRVMDSVSTAYDAYYDEV